MLNDLFINGAILIALISLGSQILINQEIVLNASFKLRILFSIMSGFIGVLLMMNSIQIMPKLILDFRSIPIVLTAIYCSFIPTIITALLIGIFRLFYFGITLSSIIGLLTSLAVGIGCGLIAKTIIKNSLKWIYMGILVLIIPSLGFSILIENHWLLLKTLSAYWIFNSVILFSVYSFMQHVQILGNNYRMYKDQSTKDHLTGLNNVRQFDKEFNRISKELTEDSLVTLLLIDIDFFKKINDEYGHQNGDKVLENLGKILMSSCSSTDIISRIGGEEFSILMTDCPRSNVFGIADRIKKVVQEYKFELINGETINITVSIGVANYSDNEINKIVEKADSALYEAKRTGRNKVVIAN